MTLVYFAQHPTYNMDKELIGVVPAFYSRYAERMEGRDLLTELEFQRENLLRLLGNLPEARGLHRYAEGKWSLVTVVQHMTDAERVFAYRAMCFARGDSTPLPGFEEDDYAAQSRADAVGLRAALEEFSAVREATICLYRNMDRATLARVGTANGSPISVAAIGVCIVSHAMHHAEVLRERYL
jgi:hypothetical protein